MSNFLLLPMPALPESSLLSGSFFTGVMNYTDCRSKILLCTFECNLVLGFSPCGGKVLMQQAPKKMMFLRHSAVLKKQNNTRQYNFLYWLNPIL